MTLPINKRRLPFDRWINMSPLRYRRVGTHESSCAAGFPNGALET